MKYQTSFAMAAFAASVCLAAAETDKKPNIVYILADDLGYGELGVYGQEKIETPNIDSLARSGMLFKQHYSGSPVCAPTRCTLMTGKHTGHAYVRGNDEVKERGDVWNYIQAIQHPEMEGQRPLPSDTKTIGDYLQKAGYRTAIVGKWGLGGPMTDSVPNRKGFDFFYGYNCQRQAHNYYPQHLWRNLQREWTGNGLLVPGTGLPDGADPYDEDNYERFTQKVYSPERMLDEALSFMERHRKTPFFLYFASPLPHVALQVPEEFRKPYRKKFGDEKPFTDIRIYFPNRYPNATYAGMISYLDMQVGEIVKSLKRLGLYDNTLIMFSSDNGPANNAGADPVFFDSAKPFKSERGWGKGSVREGGIRVPLIASWKGKVAPGSTSDHISAHWDLMATLADVAGYEAPEGTDGISFLPAMLGRQGQKEHEYLYWEYPAKGGQQAIRMGDWKGVRMDIFDGNLNIELYNLRSDPKEQDNIASSHPRIVERMREIMTNGRTVPENDKFKFETLGDFAATTK